MAKLSYSTIASVDGFVVDRAGKFDWAAPTEEVHQFVNDVERSVGTYLYGRRMYDVMSVWQSLPAPDETSDAVREYADIWRAADKIVYSTTLRLATTPNTLIKGEFDVDAVRALKESSDRDISIGGATIAGRAIASGLVDEIHLFAVPWLIGGGTRALPSEVNLPMELVEERSFANGFVHLHYRILA